MGLPTLSPHQMGAVHAAAEWWRTNPNGENPFYLAGYAGTGKSTILPVIIDHLNLDPEDVAFACPTGKAAKVMTEKLRAFPGFEKTLARTIHSWIYLPQPLKAEMLEKDLEREKAARSKFLEENKDRDYTQDEEYTKRERSIVILERDLEKAYDNVEGPNFQLNVDSAVRECRLIVIDEASMVGEYLATDIQSFGVPIFVMGDPGQLPPVSDKPGFTNAEPDYQLTEIHRQALDSPIIRVADLARRGEWLNVGFLPGQSADEWVNIIERRNDNVSYDPDRAAQIIVGTNRKRWDITSRIRKARGFTTTGPGVDEDGLSLTAQHPGLQRGDIAGEVGVHMIRLQP